MQTRIKVLSADIANKIAAGEVVERPASVLKELLENSIDAGATQIDIHIHGGGIREITVQDNGRGILAEDLSLAVQQHATSKINCVQDLASITSLGFRGEALASINSVAMLSITSHTKEQQHAWCWSNGQLMPAAHPIGTTVCMQDLFYNVPARRKFLRSERTEYIYLEEIFKRVALSALHVAFSLSHNGKVIKSLPACSNESIANANKSKRIAALCGRAALVNAITIDAEQNGMRLWGWLGNPNTASGHEQHQYFFINGRVIKDRLINHAIRTVYQNLYSVDGMPFYCLYLELDPEVLDVNVHPTKHEVRFRDPRIIHSFLTQTLSAGLEAIPQLEITPSIYNNFLPKTSMVARENLAKEFRILTIIDKYMIVAQHEECIIIVHAYNLIKEQKLLELTQNHFAVNLVKPCIVTTTQAIADNPTYLKWLNTVGFDIDVWQNMQVIVRAIPKCLHEFELDYRVLLVKLFSAWSSGSTIKECSSDIVDAIFFSKPIQMPLAQQLLTQVNQYPNSGVWRILAVSDLAKFLEPAIS